MAARLIDLRTGFTVWLVGSFVADILITGSMLYIVIRFVLQEFPLP